MGPCFYYIFVRINEINEITLIFQEMAKAKAMINQQYPGMYRFG